MSNQIRLTVLEADELFYNAFSVATIVFEEGLIPSNTQQCDLSWVIPECWGNDDISNVLEMSRSCLEAICVLRHPVRQKVEDMVLPIDFPDFTKYECYFPPADLPVPIPLQSHY